MVAALGSPDWKLDRPRTLGTSTSVVQATPCRVAVAAQSCEASSGGHCWVAFILLDGHQPHALHDSVWTFLDTLSGDLPSDWALQGNATAWFSLHRFFSALSTAKDRRVEVYHWGDSQIEGDRITNVLREAWQTQWGGRGPGWVLPLAPAPNTSIVASLEGDMVRRAGFGRGRDLTALRLPFFAVNEAIDTVSWSVKGNVKSSPTHRMDVLRPLVCGVVHGHEAGRPRPTRLGAADVAPQTGHQPHDLPNPATALQGSFGHRQGSDGPQHPLARGVGHLV